MMKRKGIAFKLICRILTSCSILFLGIFFYNYLFSKRIISENIAQNAKNLTRATVNEIDSTLLAIQEIPESIASFVENEEYTKDELITLIKSTIKDNPGVYGMGIFFEPYAFDPGSLYFGFYCYWNNGHPELTYLGSDTYQYFYRHWYQIPKELKKSLWSEPYYDEGGGDILMSTYSVPFYKTISGQKEFIGVIGVDVSLKRLQKLVSSIKIAKSGYAFLISKNGTYVTHPYTRMIMNETIFSLAEELNNKELRMIGKRMIKGESGFFPVTSIVTKKKSWVSFAPLGSSGWSLAIVFPQDELLSDIIKLNHIVLILGSLGFVILFVILFFISVSITRPIKILAQTTSDIGMGKLDFDLTHITSVDEVGMLAKSFIYMRDSLKKHIKELTETTAVKERMQSELKIAHDIQMGIIPKIFPPFPDRPEIDVYGILEPAKEVGGDFYDFFFMDDERLCFVVGDVSDKGVPASLLMAVTKTMIKSMSKDVATPDEILDRVNREIAHDNDSSMFITIFCGILNIKTGEVLYSNAGHTFPLMIHSNGEVEFLESDTGIAVGASETAVYRSDQIHFGRGDMLLIYTDGVTEAVNPVQELYNEQRLKELVQELCHKPIKEIIMEVRRRVGEFSQGMPQADDITLLSVQYFGTHGRKNSEMMNEKKIVLKNSLSEIPRLAEAVRVFAKSKKISGKIVSEIALALEEIVVNIQSYAYKDKSEHEITIIMSLTNTEFSARIIDDGEPFNPLSAPDPDINAPIEKRKVGGLGLHFVRTLMDKMEYKREEGKNILTIRKTVNLTPPAQI